MPSPNLRYFTIVSLVLLLEHVQLASSVEVFLNVTGRIRCGDKNIKAVVRLVERDFSCNQLVACTTGEADGGTFALSGYGKDIFGTLEPFLEMLAGLHRRFPLGCPCGNDSEHVKLKQIAPPEARGGDTYNKNFDIDL